MSQEEVLFSRLQDLIIRLGVVEKPRKIKVLFQTSLASTASKN